MTSPISSFSGLASGINTRDLVDAIMAAERAPLTRIESQAATVAARRQALGTYRGLLDTLRTSARALRTGTAFDATVATAQTTGGGTGKVLTASSSSSAVPGSYAVGVTSLATAQRLVSGTIADAQAALGWAGVISINGFEVTIEPADTLETVRDKIAALNTGTPPANVTPSILGIADGDRRLVLSSDTPGAAGIALADVSGTVLQDLGFLDAGGALEAGAITVPGTDAVFTIDGIAVTRSSNTVSDLIAGVTLTLEATGTATVTVGRYLDSAAQAMAGFTEAYNAVVGFLKQQGAATEANRPALYGNPALRSMRGALPSLLLSPVTGAGVDLANARSAGLSLTKSGTLEFDRATFEAAFTSRIDDLRLLFTEKLTASDAGVSFVSAGGSMTPGTAAIEITAAASKATMISAGFNGSYDAGATPDTLTIIDNRTGLSTNVALTSGMSSSDIAEAINAAFATDGLEITATTEGNEVRLTHTASGATAGISISIAGTGDGASELFTASATQYGTNVAGTIGGEAATGLGDLLVGAEGTAHAGWTVRYDGASTGPLGTVALHAGVGAVFERMLDGVLAEATGSLAQQETALDDRSRSLDASGDTVAGRLERRRAALLRQFLQMETAIARIQGQSSAIASLLPKQESR